MKKLDKLNNLLIDLINRYMGALYLLAVLVISILIRYKLFKFESPDMLHYLQAWMQEITAKGGFASLRESIGTYNVPYMVILTIIASISDVAADRMFMVKLLSAFFDYFLAGFVYLTLRKDHYKREALFGGAAILLNPLILLNSAYWGQCDVIYVAFVVMSLYFCLKEKWFVTFLLFGFGFAFKLQAVFFLPILVLCWVIKRFNFIYFFLIPIPDLLLSLPAMFAGRSLLEVVGIYYEQTEVFPEMAKNYPGIHFIFRGDYKDLYWVSILFTAFVIGSGLYYYLTRKTHNGKNLMALSIWCIWSCVMFLPSMHERYGLAMEVLLILYVLLYKERFEVCVGVYFCILCVYSSYLFWMEPWDKIYTSVINLLFYLYYTYMFFKNHAKVEKRVGEG